MLQKNAASNTSHYSIPEARPNKDQHANSGACVRASQETSLPHANLKQEKTSCYHYHHNCGKNRSGIESPHTIILLANIETSGSRNYQPSATYPGKNLLLFFKNYMPISPSNNLEDQCHFERNNPTPLNSNLKTCRSTRTQVNPNSALKGTKHHQSDPSNVPRILGSSYL